MRGGINDCRCPPPDLFEVGYGPLESHRAQRAPLDPGDDLVKGRRLGQSVQPGGPVALEGGAAGSGTLSESGVDVFDDIPRQDVRHACIKHGRVSTNLDLG